MPVSAVLEVVRGLPGAGKTTHARAIVARDPSIRHIETDDFMQKDVEGKLVVTGGRDAAAKVAVACFEAVRAALLSGRSVVLAACLPYRWQVDAYADLARRLRAHFVLVDLYDAGLTDEELAARNVNGVPADRIAAIRARYEEVT